MVADGCWHQHKWQTACTVPQQCATNDNGMRNVVPMHHNTFAACSGMKMQKGRVCCNTNSKTAYMRRYCTKHKYVNSAWISLQHDYPPTWVQHAGSKNNHDVMHDDISITSLLCAAMHESAHGKCTTSQKVKVFAHMGAAQKCENVLQVQVSHDIAKTWHCVLLLMYAPTTIKLFMCARTQVWALICPNKYTCTKLLQLPICFKLMLN